MSINNCCKCFGSYTPNKPTPCPPPTKNTGCISIGNILVKECDGAAPGQQGEVDITCFDFSGCGEADINFEILNIEGADNLLSYQFTPETFTYTLAETAIGGEKITITFRASCLTDNCGLLSDIGCITIFVKNLCKGVICGDCEECSYLTGLCEVVCPELIVDEELTSFVGTGPNPDISVN